MEEELARLERRGDEVWELLQDPLLPVLDREELEQELERITERFMELGDEDMSTLSSCESESIGPDEYDREGLLIYGQSDFMCG
jgi:hypothetical protein